METDYRPHVERAITYILEHLGEPLPLSSVARVAHLSEYHFHRIFSGVVREPVGQFITRKRLEVAALRLAYEPARPIGEIALDVGYSSISNFSKAFSGFFGCSPSDVRTKHDAVPEKIGKLTQRYGKSFRPAELFSLPAGQSRDERRARARELERALRFIDTEGFFIACLAAPPGYDVQEIERTFEDLIARGRGLGLCGEDVDTYGIAFDSPQLTSTELQRYHACIPCDERVVLEPPLFRSRVPSGRYAVFHYQGHTSAIEPFILDVYSVWFPESGVLPDDFHVLTHYIHDWPEDEHVDFEIWFKVRENA